MIAMYGLLSLLAVTAAATIGFILLAAWWASSGKTDSLVAIQAMLSRLRMLADFMKNFGGGWAWFCGAVVVIGGGIFFQRLGKARAEADLSRKAELESEEVLRQAKAGVLPEIPASEEMKKLFKLGEQVVNRRSELIRSGGKDSDIEELDELLDQLRHEIARVDMVRRMNMRMTPEELRLEQPDSFWGRVGTFFIAPGLARLLTRGTKWTLGGLTAAFVACSVGFNAPTLSADLNQQITFAQSAVDRLEVSAAATAAAAEFTEALEKLPESEPLTKEEEDEADDISSAIAIAYEQNLVRYYSGLDSVVPGVRNTYAARSNLIRDELLKAHGAASASVEHVPSDLAKKPGVASEAVRSSLDPKKPAKPVTAAGRQVKESTLKVVRKGGKSVLQKLQKEMAAFKVPMRPGTVGQILVSEFGGDLLDGKSRTRFDFQNTLDESLRDAMSRGNTGRADLVGSKLAEGKIEEAMRAAFPADVTQEKFQPQSDMAEIRKVVQPEATRIVQPMEMGTGTSPALRARVESQVHLSSVEKHLSNFYVRAGGGERVRQTLDVLADYPDYFPGQVGEENLTPQGKLRTKLESPDFVRKAASETNDLLAFSNPPDAPNGLGRGPGIEPGPGSGPGTGPINPGSPGIPGNPGGLGGPGNRAPPKTPGPGRYVSAPEPLRVAPRSTSIASAARARSFTRLRGFARVGGVLIGQEQEGDSSVRVARLDWEITPDRKVILRASGSVSGQPKEWVSSPLDADALYCGLMYAADGRATAVTMVRADPLTELKILAHPAVLDTRIGQALIDLDRFVDTYANAKPRTEAENVVQSAHMLYELAWSARASMLQPRRSRILSLYTDGEQVGRFLDRIALQVDQVKTAAGLSGGEHPKFQLALELVKKAGGITKLTSPLVGKTEFYEADLVQMLDAAVGSSTHISDLWIKLTGQFEKSLEAPEAPEPGFALLNKSPALFSGLYSKDVDEKLGDCLKSTMRGFPMFFPEFQIWSGVRELKFKADGEGLLPKVGAQPFDFMLQVAFTSPPFFGPAADSDDDYSDENPWEFPQIASWIRTEVQKKLKEDPESFETLRLSSEFALSQRFFRLAFSGALGEDFPLQRLQELGGVLKPLLPPAQRTPRWNSRPGVALAVLSQLVMEAQSQLPAGQTASELPALLEQADKKLAVALTAEEAFREACLQLLAAPDRGSPEWSRKWDGAWAAAEKQKIAWEQDWQTFFIPIQRLSVASEAGGEKSQMQNLFLQMDLQSTAIRIRRDLGVHVDDKQSMLSISRQEAMFAFQKKKAPSNVPE